MKFPQHNYQLVTQDFDCYIWFIWSSEHQVLEYAEIMIHYNVTGHWPRTGLSGIDKIVINSTKDLLVGKLVINIQIDIVYVFIGGIECLVHYILGSCRFGGRVMAARTWRWSGLYGCSSRGCPGLELAVCGDAPEAGVYGLAGRVGHVVVLGQVPVLVPGDHNIQHLF